MTCKWRKPVISTEEAGAGGQEFKATKKLKIPSFYTEKLCLEKPKRKNTLILNYIKLFKRKIFVYFLLL